MATERTTMLDGRVQVYQRQESRHWWCSASVAGRRYRCSTNEESLSLAKEFAEDWYLTLRGKFRSGELKSGKPFREAAEHFLEEFRAMTAGQRSETYLTRQAERVRKHVIPFFEKLLVTEITSGKVQEYRLHRARDPVTGRPTARNTLHQEIVALRQILKAALRREWITSIPDLSAPYKASGKVGHRAWFSPEEYKRLYEATRARIGKAPSSRWRWAWEQLHDYVLFMANTGLRPDEAAQLQFRDVSPQLDEATQEKILVIEVRGKRGIGYCKSTGNAVRPFERLLARRRPPFDGEVVSKAVEAKAWTMPAPSDLLFPGERRHLLNKVLQELGLRVDRDGNRRTAYSFRHTYICFRLMEGADIYQIAKNCRTSVEMIESHYAKHIKNVLDAAAINVRRPRSGGNGARTEAKKPARRGLKVQRSARVSPEGASAGRIDDTMERACETEARGE